MMTEFLKSTSAMPSAACRRPATQQRVEDLGMSLLISSKSTTEYGFLSTAS